MNDFGEYHLTTFDGGGTTGWAHFCVGLRAFSRPEHMVMKYLKWWDCGEYTGTDFDIYQAATKHIADTVSVFGHGASYLLYNVVAEEFQLTQLVGGAENLTSPLRFNSVIAWECWQRSIRFELQARQMRTQIDNNYLRRAGFDSPFRANGNWGTSGRGKDAFAAMQHGVEYLRRVKAESRKRPWKLTYKGVMNSRWDCACERKKPCDMLHPRTR